jgi:RNA polymerase sigma-70 factor (ECF subfamily)
MGAPSVADGVASRRGDGEVVAALLRGDEATFLSLVELHHHWMVHLARCHVGSEAAAEEVARKTWMALLRALERWDARSTLRGWLLARVLQEASARLGPTISPSRPPDSLSASGDAPDAGLPEPTSGWSEDRPGHLEVVVSTEAALEALPPMERAVLTLRDLAGCDGPEVAAALGLSVESQRAFLHRARSKVCRVMAGQARSRAFDP